MLTLHCPPNHLHALASLLRDKGAETVEAISVDYVFSRANPLYDRLEAGLDDPLGGITLPRD
jgi:ATP phosphoribosyltransferase